MILVHRPLAYHRRASFSINGGKKLTAPLSSTATVCFSKSPSNLSPRCSSNDKGSVNHHEGSGQEEFTVLGGAGIPWDTATLWSTFAFYLFSLHIPLSFGGLSFVSNVLHQPVLDPQTQAISLLGIQLFELSATLCLLKSTAKPEFEHLSIFKADKSQIERNPWLASALGFGSLVLLVFLTSFLADSFLVPKTTNSPILKEILLSSNVSTAACALAYCVLIPLLEEIVYRGFLLRSISSSMKWQQAILLSSAIFSAIHFSGENSLQLFIIGCVLGCSYCWTGDLKSSIVIHSLYNAMILAITYIY